MIRELVVHDCLPHLPVNPRRRGEKIPTRTRPPELLVWHCDAAPKSAGWDWHRLAMYDINPNHISAQGLLTPTYQWYVTRDGLIWKIAQEAWITAHAGVRSAWRKQFGIPDWNQRALAVCFAHDPTFENGLTPAQMESGLLLSAEVITRRPIQSSMVKGHRELEGTGYYPGKPRKLLKTCPGLGIDLERVRADVRELKLKMQGGELGIRVVMRDI